jgi:hypothetical protein
MEKKTFNEWVTGFEERYTSEELAMFEEVWNTAVLIRKVNETYHNEENEWNMKWIFDVANRIGK